jgi:hypothetical protein
MIAIATNDILIHKQKRGFYRRDAMGYTGDPIQAGRFSADQAQRLVDFDPDTFTLYRVVDALSNAKEFIVLNDRLALVTETDGGEVLYRHAETWERWMALSEMGVGAQALRVMAEEIRTLRRRIVGRDELSAAALEHDGLLVKANIMPQPITASPEPN